MMGALYLVLVACTACLVIEASSDELSLVLPVLPDAPPTKEQLEQQEKGFVLKALPPKSFPGKNSQPQQAGQDATVNSHIVGGAVVTRGSYPWQVTVEQDNARLCGGSLISNQWVLTAAHCVVGRTNFVLTLGNQDRSAAFENGRVVIHTTLKYPHAQYNSTNLINDIALLKFPFTVSLPTTFFNAIRLPKQSQQTTTFVDVIATACGWGKTADNATTSLVLKCANLTVISNAVCAQTYGATIIASTLCVNTNYTGVSQSICQGDSGGPLAVKESDGKWTLIGVTSFTSSLGCQALKPGGFARVTSFLSWISTTSGIAIVP